MHSIKYISLKHVAILDNNEADGTKTCEELKQKYGELRVSYRKVDVTNIKDFESVFQDLLNIFGKLDIIVNNAGIIREHDYELMINVNLTSYIRGTHLAIKYISKIPRDTSKSELESPIVLNIASATAFLDFTVLPEYAATKGGVVSFVRSIGNKSLLEKKGIRIVALCPGFTPNTQLFNSLGEDYKMNEKEFVKNEKKQTCDVVGRAAVEVIRRGETGSVWVVDGGDLHIVKLPYLQTCTELVQTNL